MKKISFFHTMAAALMLAATFTACSSDDEGSDNPPVPPTPYHYDLTVTVGNHGGMSKDKNGHLLMSVTSLSDAAQTISFQGKGAEVTDYTMECIYKGKYMYQVPVSADRFSKLQFKNNTLQVVQEQKFGENTYKSRNYTHAWINDNTLVIMASTGDNDKVIWTKLNTDNMTIISEGTLNVSQPDGYTVLTTSGLLTYRESDGKLLYFYYWKTKKKGGVEESTFRIAVVNPSDMSVEQENVATVEAGAKPQGSAYGELLQNFICYDDDGNLYMTVFNEVDGKDYGRLVRIKKGQYNFESGYNAFPEAKGKLLTVQYIGNGKVLGYSGDVSVGKGIDDIAYYYSIIDLNTKSS